ncbi:hypothetical protein PROAA_900004 [Candidatus Propionivibrio aalborgensis]|uniref:Uncharacterized protein n=1 Tax=Candidatus Propionivibrio aalborgensis TaxID=1860101 RepID=A0A1A8Y2E6_9RHOO|nr:hypothetical protein PROAA_900004 [Candidatus Propionivibrio aalborgensis]
MGVISLEEVGWRAGRLLYSNKNHPPATTEKASTSDIARKWEGSCIATNSLALYVLLFWGIVSSWYVKCKTLQFVGHKSDTSSAEKKKG